MHRSAVLLGAVLCLGAPALAQAPPGPPPVLMITVEEIKPGSMAAHEKSVGSYLALWERAKVPAGRIGLQPVSGDTNQVVYLQGYESYAAMEAANQKQEQTIAANPMWQAEIERLDRESGPLHASQKTIIASFRPDLSYQPLTMDAVAKARYFNVRTTTVNPGRGGDYAEYMKQLNHARDKAQVADIHTAVYQVMSGAPGGTFVTLFVNRSLADEDAFRKASDARSKAVNEALGGDSVVKQRAALAEQVFATGAGMDTLYSVNRKLSQPTAQFAAYDPEFWAPTASGKALAIKKEEKK
jgi:hypothetical protein